MIFLGFRVVFKVFLVVFSLSFSFHRGVWCLQVFFDPKLLWGSPHGQATYFKINPRGLPHNMFLERLFMLRDHLGLWVQQTFLKTPPMFQRRNE